MSNIIRKTTSLASHIVSSYLFAGSILVDATCGNGHDTLMLASSSPSKLYAFDIQHEAVKNTKNLLVKNGYDKKIKDGTISIICESHVFMSRHVKEQVHVIMFNLGYLPGGDKSFSTTHEDTLSAVNTSLNLLAVNGLLCITVYSGHDEGKKEKESLLTTISALDPQTYHASYIDFINQSKDAPSIILVTRKK